MRIQTKTYAKNIIQFENEKLTPSSGEYKVPFLYATNGRPFLRQLQEESGIWFWDSRKPLEYARPLEGWHSPADLLLLSQQDQDKNKQLEEDISKFGLREYQQQAVFAVEQELIEGNRRVLIAMATGTGKTRTAIALMYRLIKTKKCRRILFLVDRNSLGEQTSDFNGLKGKLQGPIKLDSKKELLSYIEKSFDDVSSKSVFPDEIPE